MKTYKYSYKPKGFGYGYRKWATGHTYSRYTPKSSGASGIIASMIARLFFKRF